MFLSHLGKFTQLLPEAQATPVAEIGSRARHREDVLVVGGWWLSVSQSVPRRGRGLWVLLALLVLTFPWTHRSLSTLTAVSLPETPSSQPPSTCPSKEGDTLEERMEEGWALDRVDARGGGVRGLGVGRSGSHKGDGGGCREPLPPCRLPPSTWISLPPSPPAPEIGLQRAWLQSWKRVSQWPGRPGRARLAGWAGRAARGE